LFYNTEFVGYDKYRESKCEFKVYIEYNEKVENHIRMKTKNVNEMG